MTAARPAHPTTAVLFLYVLGQLQEAHATAIDRHLKHCARCRDHTQTVENDAAHLSLALPPVAVPAWIRESLLNNAREVHRLRDAVPLLCRLLRLSLPEAQDILSKIDVPRFWQQQQDAWVLPLACPAPRQAELVRLGPGGSYRWPSTRQGHFCILQGQAYNLSPGGGRPQRLPHLAGQPLRWPRGARLAGYPGPDVVLLAYWTVKLPARAQPFAAVVHGAVSRRKQGMARPGPAQKTVKGTKDSVTPPPR